MRALNVNMCISYSSWLWNFEDATLFLSREMSVIFEVSCEVSLYLLRARHSVFPKSRAFLRGFVS